MTRKLRSFEWKTLTGALAGGAAIALTLSACGGSGATGATGATGAAGGSSAGKTAGGTLTVCSDMGSPPLSFLDSANKPTGAEVELGDAMAAKMGKKFVWANTSFNGIIPALQTKRCDLIMSQLYIKPAREKIVDFVPYMYSGSTLLVKESGGPKISSSADLCGKKAAAETGTTVVDYLQQASKQCQKSGKAAIDIRQFQDDPSALQQLKVGLVAAYGTTVETSAYTIKKSPGQFKMAGKPFNKIKVGAATRKDDRALHDEIAKALAAIHSDGQYAAIMKKWGLTFDELSVSK